MVVHEIFSYSNSFVLSCAVAYEEATSGLGPRSWMKKPSCNESITLHAAMPCGTLDLATFENAHTSHMDYFCGP